VAKLLALFIRLLLCRSIKLLAIQISDSTLDLGLKVRLRCNAIATCFTSSLRMPSSSNCFGSICVQQKHGYALATRTRNSALANKPRDALVQCA